MPPDPPKTLVSWELAWPINRTLIIWSRFLRYAPSPRKILDMGLTFQTTFLFPFGVRSEFVGIRRIVIPRPDRTRGRLPHPDPQKPDRTPCQAIGPGRNRSQGNSKAQGKFIVLSIYLLDTCEM